MSIVQESFPQAVNDALQTVSRILEVERDPRLAEKVDHEYIDKYRLADQVTNMSLIALMNVFESMGLTKKHLEKIATDPSSSKTLRFQATDSCKFLKEQVVNVTVDGESTQTTSEEVSSDSRASQFFRTGRSTIQKVVKEVKEYHWNVDVQWELFLYSGSDAKATKQVLSNRTTSMVVVVQSSKKAPLPEYRDHPPIELPVTWFFQQVDTESAKAKYSIDRTISKTPLRNDQVHQALKNMAAWRDWAFSVRSYFVTNLQKDIVEKHHPAIITADSNSMPMLSSVSASKVFVPILPILENSTEDPTPTPTNGSSAERKSSFSLPNDSDENAKKTPLLSSEDMHRFLNEQIRSLQEKTGSLERFFPNKNHVKLHSVSEATFVMLCLHITNISQRYAQCMEYLERMLEEQLVAAIGKRVTSDDLDAFCRFHYARLFHPRPVPFCHSIRQSGHYPVGMVSIECTTSVNFTNRSCIDDSNKNREPIETFVRRLSAGDNKDSLKIPLNAATTAELTGETFLHGWVNNRFESKTKKFDLIARARQFSAYLLVIGTMTATDHLKPKEAIILRNKDEVILPMLLNEIPSAKEFKDAIQSLSPEQQRFSRAFRNMQLESSVFGVCVIQIKPQLEILLDLPADALTKEMKLTEELMELFCEHQVPSDLLSYNGSDASASVEDKIANVKAHVAAVLEVIDKAKSKQLEEATMKADMRLESVIADDPSVMSAPVYTRNSASLSNEERERILLRKLERGGTSQLGMAFPGTAAMAVPTTIAARSRVATPSVPENISTTQTARPIPTAGGSPVSASGGFDITHVPKTLDATIEKHISDSTLRTTVISTGDSWTRLRQVNLLTKPKSTILSSDVVQSERNKAFDLLDAMSRSGSLPIAFSELHVIVCVTHSFEKNVMNTLIQDNINPIEKLEMSALLVASTIHGTPAGDLIQDDQENRRLTANFPSLLAHAETD